MDQSQQIAKAVEILREGGLVAFPTETVYGLGADANNPEALRRLYSLKGRPLDHPSIVHVTGTEALESWCRDIPDAAILLATLFWPGPLTLVLKKRKGVPDELTGGQDTVAIRVPSHPVALKLLSAFGSGVAAPSANRFGHISPTSATDVRGEFGDEVMVLDGGPCQVGIESTIIDLSAGRPRVLRPGMILEESINVALSEVGLAPKGETDSPRVPGSLPSHYAPHKPVELVESSSLQDAVSGLLNKGKTPGVLAYSTSSAGYGAGPVSIQMSQSPAHYAFSLYRSLRELDGNEKVDFILIEEPPAKPEWVGIRDRVTRAAGQRLDTSVTEVGNGT